MKKKYSAPTVSFKSLNLNSNIADTCWAYAANNKTFWYQWIYNCDGVQEKLKFNILPTGKCDTGGPGNVQYTVPLTSCDYAAKDNLFWYFAATNPNRLGGNSAEPWKGTTITPFTNGVILSYF